MKKDGRKKNGVKKGTKRGSYKKNKEETSTFSVRHDKKVIDGAIENHTKKGVTEALKKELNSLAKRK